MVPSVVRKFVLVTGNTVTGKIYQSLKLLVIYFLISFTPVPALKMQLSILRTILSVIGLLAKRCTGCFRVYSAVDLWVAYRPAWARGTRGERREAPRSLP